MVYCVELKLHYKTECPTKTSWSSVEQLTPWFISFLRRFRQSVTTTDLMRFLFFFSLICNGSSGVMESCKSYHPRTQQSFTSKCPTLSVECPTKISWSSVEQLSPWFISFLRRFRQSVTTTDLMRFLFLVKKESYL